MSCRLPTTDGLVFCVAPFCIFRKRNWAQLRATFWLFRRTRARNRQWSVAYLSPRPFVLHNQVSCSPFRFRTCNKCPGCVPHFAFRECSTDVPNGPSYAGEKSPRPWLGGTFRVPCSHSTKSRVSCSIRRVNMLAALTLGAAGGLSASVSMMGSLRVPRPRKMGYSTHLLIPLEHPGTQPRFVSVQQMGQMAHRTTFNS